MPPPDFGQPSPSAAGERGSRQRVWLSQGEMAQLEGGVRRVKNQLLSERKAHARREGRLQQELSVQQAIAHRLYNYLKVQSVLGGLVGGRRERRLCDLATVFAPRWEPALARRFLAWRAAGVSAARENRAVDRHRRRSERRLRAGCFTEWRCIARAHAIEADRTLAFQLGLASLAQGRVDGVRALACFGTWRDWARRAVGRRSQAKAAARGAALRAQVEAFEAWRGVGMQIRHQEAIIGALSRWRGRSDVLGVLRGWKEISTRAAARRTNLRLWITSRSRERQAGCLLAWALESRRTSLLESRFGALRARTTLRRAARAWSAWREYLVRLAVARDGARALAEQEEAFSEVVLQWEAERDGLMAGLEEAGARYRSLEDNREADFSERLVKQRVEEQRLREELRGVKLALDAAEREREEVATRLKEETAAREAEAESSRAHLEAALADKDAEAEAFVQSMQREHEAALERVRSQTLVAETRLRDKLEAELGLAQEMYAGKELQSNEKLERQAQEVRLATERISGLERQVASLQADLDGQAEALSTVALESERQAEERVANLQSDNAALIRQQETWRHDMLELGAKRLTGRLSGRALRRVFQGWQWWASAMAQAQRMHQGVASCMQRALFMRWREETERRARERGLPRSPRRRLLSSVQSLQEAMSWGTAPRDLILDVFFSHSDHMRWQRKLNLALWHWRGLVGLNQTSAKVSQRFTSGRRLRVSFAAWVACTEGARARDYLARRAAQRIRRGLTWRVFGHWRRETAAGSLQKRRLVEAIVRWSARMVRDALRAWWEGSATQRSQVKRISALVGRWGARLVAAYFEIWVAALYRSKRQQAQRLGMLMKQLRRRQYRSFTWWRRWSKERQLKASHRAALETVSRLEKSLYALEFREREVEMERDEAKERLSDMMTAVSSLNWKLQDQHWEGPPWQVLANIQGSLKPSQRPAPSLASTGPATQKRHVFSNRFVSPRGAGPQA